MSFAAGPLTHRYGRRAALDGVNFSARAGEVTAIIGPNGSGKTTLMRCLAGEIDAGPVTLEGRLLSGMKPWQVAARRAVLPQAAVLAFPFTALEVVGIGQQAGIHATAPGLGRRALARVGLLPLADRPCQELSGGEQARVHLARALAQVWEPVTDEGPCWLLLDEPVASLDIAHQLQVMRLARDYAASGGGVIAVMHDLNLTAMAADRIFLMKSGRVLASGSPDDVLTDTLLSEAYDCPIRVGAVPDTRFVLPHATDCAPGLSAP